MDRTPGSDDMLAEYEQDRIDAARDRSFLEEEEDVEDDEDGDGAQDARGADGRLRVLSAQCSTCIGRPGNLMHLNPGRVREMVRGSLEGGGYITCHATLTYGENPGFGPAVCRWFYDRFGEQSNLLRIMARLGGLNLTVTPPAKEADRG